MGLRFGTDGIRGVANAELGAELVMALGRAAARALDASCFLVGRDTRRSGPLLQAALSAGMASEGADVGDLGVLPTPGVAWLAAQRGYPAAVVSASHNLFADNGIKLFAAGGLKLPDATEAAVEEELARVIASTGPLSDPPVGHGVGMVSAEPEARHAYVDHLVGVLDGRDLRGMRIVVDCANGAASSVAPEVFERLGAVVIAIANTPDGININDGCGSTDPTILAARVVEEGADLGLGFDGDADRVFLIDERAQPLEHTTPEAPELQSLLARMRDQGVRTVALEVSSHALAQHRVDGTWFAVVCFTNLTRDHLDYHPSLEDYFESKALLFDPARAGAATVNLDDPRGPELARRCRDQGLAVTTFALTDRDADVVADSVVVDDAGGRFTMVTGDQRLALHTPLLGSVNAENALAAAVTARAAGFAPEAIAAGLASVSTIPGRLERVDAGQPFSVLVDYAHTPDALRAALGAARGLAPTRQLIVVFGCGGDRDHEKRPEMGREAARSADLVIVTSDNARSEAPAAIAAAVLAGTSDGPAPVRVELDRRAAIRQALDAAGEGDVVLIAGKGHETSQQAGGRELPFDDRVVAREELGASSWT